MLTIKLELTEIDIKTLQRMYTDADDDLSDVLRYGSDDEDIYTDDFWESAEDLKNETQVLKKICHAIEGITE